LILQRSVTQCLGEAAAEYVDPVNHISLAHIIKANEDHRLLLGTSEDSYALSLSSSQVDKMDSEELVVENPASFTILLDLLTSSLPRHIPFSN
jgi:hypothetical protein